MSYSYSYGITITDCTEVFGLNKFSPEEIVDKVFSSSQRVLPENQFKQAFHNAFRNTGSQDKASNIDACLQKVFEVSSQGSKEVTPAALGRNISIFTNKPTVSNPVRDLFFALDKNYSGVATESEVMETISGISDTSLLNTIKNQFSDFKRAFPQGNPNSFSITYWDLYSQRSHPLVQNLLVAHKKLQEGRFSGSPTKTTTSYQVTSSPIGNYGVSTTTTTTTYQNYSSSSPTQHLPSNTTDNKVTIKPQSTSSPNYFPIENLGERNISIGQASQNRTPSNISSGQTSSPQKTPQIIQTQRIPSNTTQSPENTSAKHKGPSPGLQTAMGLQNRQTKALQSFQDFLDLRARLGFQLLSAKDVILKIRESIGHIHFMTLDEFIMVFVDLFRGKFANYYEFIDSLVQIFQFIDLNGNGALEIGETLQAFVHLFGGSEEDKIRASFLLFDLDNSGFLDTREVFELVYNTIKITQSKGESMTEEQEKYLYDVAYATTLDVFKTMDINNDDRVSIEEFMIWFKGTKGEINPTDKDAAKELREARLKNLRKKGLIKQHEHQILEQEQLEIKQQLSDANAFTHIIDEVRKLVSFERIHIHTAENLLLQMFPNKNCNYNEFFEYITELIKINKIEGEEHAAEVSRKLFNALDSNKNGILDLAELVTGLSLICGGSQTEKLKSAYDLFDANQDKILDFNEAIHFMEAFFKIMKSDTPYLLLANGDAKSYAYALAFKAFEETRTPFEYGIKFEDFNEWVQSYVCSE